ncbi:alpha/beta fold hydrolase [Flexibacterium corallicola]|uniref:alpha/beta fold hydrolase n=1 Tax=Flexibacterium corallicola TaxID=3037259 RepID=UPI00286EC002|nr:alpha/beta hydrolase [Pseudovibrio sp. M1P-2-3]
MKLPIDMQDNLVFLPGLLCDARVFSPQVKALEDRAQITVPDLTPYHSIEEMARGVLDQAPPKFSLCGFSMGGQAAMEIALQAPERVERLALIETTGLRIPAGIRERWKVGIDRINRGNFLGYVKGAFAIYFKAEPTIDPAIKQTYMDMALEIGPLIAIRHMKALMNYQRNGEKLANIKCPTTIIGGDDSMVFSLEVHRRMATAFPHATLVIINNTGHFVPLEQPEATTTALEHWLDT